MSTIVLRSVKGTPLTNTEVDTNFTNLNTDKIQIGGALGTPSSGTVTNLTGTASININGTVGATTATTGAFTTIRSSTGSSGAIFGGGSSSNEVVTITAQAGGLGIGLGIQNSSSNLSGISFPTNTSATTSYTYITADGRSGANGFIKSYVNDAVVSTLTSTGLGIGTSSPGTKLHVSLATAYVGRFAYDATYYTDIGYGGTNTVAPSNPFRYWELNGSEQMRLTSTGLGIGTSSPISKLANTASNIADAAGLTAGTSAVQWAIGVQGYAAAFYNSGVGSQFANGLLVKTTGTSNDADAIVNFESGGVNRLKLTGAGNLGLGVTPSAWTNFKVIESGYTGNSYFSNTGNTQIGISSNATYNSGWKYTRSSVASATYEQFQGAHGWYNAPSGTAGDPITFTQAMTLTAGGNLGLGATSPASMPGFSRTLQISNSSDSSLRLTGAGGSWEIGNNTANNLQFYNGASSLAMTLNSSGNLGLGVTPSAWATTNLTALELPSGTALWRQGASPNTWLSTNAYFNGANFIYKATTVASAYNQSSGTHSWYNAPSGTAGDPITFTQAMTLTAAGDLLVGATSATYNSSGRGLIEINGSSSALLGFKTGGSNRGYVYSDGTDMSVYNAISGYLSFGTNNTERARIDSSGNLLVGGTSSTVWNGGTTKKVLVLTNTNASGANAIFSGQSGATSVDYGAIFEGYATSVTSGSEALGSIAFLRENTSNTALSSYSAFYTNGSGTAAERARITSAGDLLVGATSTVLGARQYIVGTSANYVQVQNAIGSGTYYLTAFRAGGTDVGNITSNGTITVYATTSDYRLKTVIGTVTGHGERIDALEPIEYTWNVNGTRTRGFLAHKFQEVYAQSVTGTKDAVDADGNPVYQAMQASSSEVIADLVAEIQSLRKRLADAGI